MMFEVMVDKKRLEDTYVTGRNGTFLCRGIEVYASIVRNVATVTPIGKRGVINAGFQIPAESMDEICEKWIAMRQKFTCEKFKKSQKK